MDRTEARYGLRSRPKRVYTATVRRVQDHWKVDVFGLVGCTARVGEVGDVRSAARAAIAQLLDVPAGSFAIDVRFGGQRPEPLFIGHP